MIVQGDIAIRASGSTDSYGYTTSPSRSSHRRNILHVYNISDEAVVQEDQAPGTGAHALSTLIRPSLCALYTSATAPEGHTVQMTFFKNPIRSAWYKLPHISSCLTVKSSVGIASKQVPRGYQQVTLTESGHEFQIDMCKLRTLKHGFV